jgi:membrane fusion protein, multidrug efflux system
MKGRAVGALALVALAALALWWFEFRGAPPKAAAEGVQPSIPVTAGTVVARDMPVVVHAIGTVEAHNKVAVKSRVDGQIMKLDFTEGQEVKAGAPLVQIDPRPFEAALEQARAAKQKDEAQLASAEADLARYSKLLGSGYQTRQSYDQQKALVGQLKAAIKGDQAQIDSAKVNLAYTDIRAPISGRLGARLVDVGNVVRASNNTVLVTINQIQPIFVSFTVPEHWLDEIRRHQAAAPLAVTALARGGETVLGNGKLTFIDNAVDQASGTIALKALFANRHERLWPGEFVTVRLVLRVLRAVPTVPAQTVEEGPHGYYAYVIKPNLTVARRAVSVDTIENGLAVVTKGLSPGERVVVDGLYRLTDGARVHVKPARRPGSTS